MAKRTKNDALPTISDDDLMTALERVLGNMPASLSEMQANRAVAPLGAASLLPTNQPIQNTGVAPTPGGGRNMAALLGGMGPPAGMGFIDPAVMTQNPSMIPPHSGNVVQWLGGAMQPNKNENLLAGIAAVNNILTSLELQKRQKKQQEMLANLSPEDAQRLMFLSMLQGGMGGGR